MCAVCHADAASRGFGYREEDCPGCEASVFMCADCSVDDVQCAHGGDE